MADLQKKDVGIFISDYGHGKHDPWGATHILDKEFGMDDRWFLSLEDAIINSACWIGQLPDDYEIQSLRALKASVLYGNSDGENMFVMANSSCVLAYFVSS